MGRCLDLDIWRSLSAFASGIGPSILGIGNGPLPHFPAFHRTQSIRMCGCTMKAKDTYTEQLHESFCRDSSERIQASYSSLGAGHSSVNWNSTDPPGQGLPLK